MLRIVIPVRLALGVSVLGAGIDVSTIHHRVSLGIAKRVGAPLVAGTRFSKLLSH